MSALITSLFSKFLLDKKQMKVFAKGMGSANEFANKAKDLFGVNESAGKLLSAFNLLKVPLKLITADFIGPIMSSNIVLMREVMTLTNKSSVKEALDSVLKVLQILIAFSTVWFKMAGGVADFIEKLKEFFSWLTQLRTVTNGLNANLGPMITKLARLLFLVSLPVDSSSIQTYVNYQVAPPNDLAVQPPSGTGDYGDGTIF